MASKLCRAVKQLFGHAQVFSFCIVNNQFFMNFLWRYDLTPPYGECGGELVKQYFVNP